MRQLGWFHLALLSIFRYVGFSILGFVRAPPMACDEERDSAFDELLEGVLQNNVETIPYILSYPKHEFLIHLSKKDKYLMHGSPQGNIKVFEPRVQTSFYGKQVKAVFASSDGIWSMFFAILNRTILSQYRNGCFSVDKNSTIRNRYFFSVPAGMLERNPWVHGFVYVLPKSGFQQSDTPNEWICSNSVVPLTKLHVMHSDFPFLTRITEYKPTNSMINFFIRNAIQSRLMKNRYQPPTA
jgi:hypothetical protein